MIISLRFKNFFSIRDEAVLDFTADMSSRKSRAALPENLIDFSGDKFVNIMGLFGSNAAGKSNIIKALSFCRGLVLHSHLNAGDEKMDFEPFKFDADHPSEFYINFVTQGIEYEYEFHLHKDKIIFEQLYHYPNKRRAKVFSREKTSSYSHRKGTIERPTEVETNTGARTLFVSQASSMNRSIPKAIYHFFKEEILIGLDSGAEYRPDIAELENLKPILLEALAASDSDIVDIKVDMLNPNMPRLISFHKENPALPFDFAREESDGTKRLFMLLVKILRKSIDGAAIFMDEFDLKLHLRLAEFLLDTVRASGKGQMVFTSHNPSLIDTSKLRPEQIVFVTKHEDGNSEFIPLSDYEGLKSSMNAREAYLQGRFDAVPYVGNIYPILAEFIAQR